MVNSFLCEIVELITEIPAEGGLISLCSDYLITKDKNIVPDIIIDAKGFEFDKFPNLSKESVFYIEAGRQFNSKLLDYNGLYLHSSAVEFEGKAFLFSGNCGVGKSTHTKLWQSTFGENARIFNDDKPALRKIDSTWYAYGTPWCGKDHININIKVPLCGICFLKQGDENHIRRLTPFEAVERILPQTFNKFKRAEHLDAMLSLVDDIVRTIPVFELENCPNESAARLSYTTMLSAAKELGL